MEFLTQSDPRFPRGESVLYGKRILFCGDSICAASVYDYADTYRWGWAGRISAATGCSYHNTGVDGAALSTCRGENRVLSQLERCRDIPLDLIVLHGGVNDAWECCPVGCVTGGFSGEDFDGSTCAGGLEELLAYARERFPAVPVCFLVNFPAPACQIGQIPHMGVYVAELLAVCRKWSVPVLDLYHDQALAQRLRVTEQVHTADRLHPTGSGYDILYRPIQRFLEGLLTYHTT